MGDPNKKLKTTTRGTLTNNEKKKLTGGPLQKELDRGTLTKKNWTGGTLTKN